jgi:transposase
MTKNSMAVDGRKLDSSALYQLRLQAIRLREAGRSGIEIAEITGLSAEWLSRIWKKYQKEGLDGLKPQIRGRQIGTNRTLDAKQEEEIRKTLETSTPDQHNLPRALWSREAICMLMEDRFGIKMPLRTISLYLQRWNFTYQRPLRRSYAQQPEAVQKWLDEEYPRIAQEALEEKAEIYWCDETGVRNENQGVRGFSPMGQTPVFNVEPKRYGINMISAVTNLGELRFMMYKNTLTGSLLTQFLSRLTSSGKKDGSRVYVILDNLRAHHSKKLKDWVKAHEKQIRVCYLPSYSPELNPDEYLNNHLKQDLRKRGHARTQEELEGRVRRFMMKLRHRTHVIRAYFEHPSISYAA